MSDASIAMRTSPGGAGSVCRDILERLPSWFRIEEAVDEYVATADAHASVIASVDGEDVGIIVVLAHSPFAAEVHLMAVVPEWHRRGVGSAMLAHVERTLAADGVEYLQVKTLSPANPDEGYAKTRTFYTSKGFRVLEEFPTLWDPENPALQMIKSMTPQ